MSLNASNIASTGSVSIQSQIEALSPQLALSAKRYFMLESDADSLAAETIRIGRRELLAGEADAVKASLFAIMHRLYLSAL